MHIGDSNGIFFAFLSVSALWIPLMSGISRYWIPLGSGILDSGTKAGLRG
jgi:hypothetical protein